MALRVSRKSAALAMAAALALAASPAMARDRGGWGGGWGGGRGWGHHDDGIDAGDIFAGIFVIGAIAAIAGAASKANKDHQSSDARGSDGRYSDRESRDRAYGYGGNTSDREQSRSYNSARGIDGAVDLCVSEVERGSRTVDTVDSVNRDADGWRIEGRVRGGSGFACAVNGAGRIRSVTVDGHAAYAGDEPAEQSGG